MRYFIRMPDVRQVVTRHCGRSRKRHCEERSDEAILYHGRDAQDCRALRARNDEAVAYCLRYARKKAASTLMTASSSPSSGQVMLKRSSQAGVAARRLTKSIYMRAMGSSVG